MTQKVLWTIRTTARLTAETWQTFVTRTREAGTTPARVLEDFITSYTGPPDQEPRQPPDDR